MGVLRNFLSRICRDIAEGLREYARDKNTMEGRLDRLRNERDLIYSNPIYDRINSLDD